MVAASFTKMTVWFPGKLKYECGRNGDTISKPDTCTIAFPYHIRIPFPIILPYKYGGCLHQTVHKKKRERLYLKPQLLCGYCICSPYTYDTPDGYADKREQNTLHGRCCTYSKYFLRNLWGTAFILKVSSSLCLRRYTAYIMAHPCESAVAHAAPSTPSPK